jgi:type III secretion system YscI/HrpB-like protein
METLAIEAIRASQSATSAQAAAAGSGVSSERLAAPSATAVSKFEAAMAANAPTAVSEVPFASQVSAVWRSAQANNQGMLHRIKALTEISAQHSLSAPELLELQYEVVNLSFQQDVVTKVADKASNAVQTLIKNQ